MKRILFVGPTLYGSEALARAREAVIVLPPARRGDILDAVTGGVDVIGLVDGNFRATPAVLHKEILWALSRGVRVFGAASMGALRAAETDTFGTIGVGAIYRDYRDGRLWRDDEVAIEHAPRELGFQPVSEALVNMRYTFTHAARSGKLSDAQAQALIDIAAAMFYPERSYRSVLDRHATARPGEALTRAAQDWILDNRIDQKARDAHELLAILQSHEVPADVSGPTFEFADTSYFREFRARRTNPFLFGTD